MRGRKPKPTEQKKLAGNPGKRPINAVEPQLPVSSGFDAVPLELAADGAASTEWQRTAPMLRERKVITDGDRGALIALCQQWSIYQQAVQKWSTMGMIVKAPSGYPMVNPYLGIANKALTNCMKIWAELGLTPSSRSRVHAVPDAEARDPFAEFDEPSKGKHASH
jgi:P27 family predicted phage terminase small subunit